MIPMMKRFLMLVPVAVVCLAAAPAALPSAVPATVVKAGQGAVPTAAQFERLATTDVIAALDASLARQRRDVRGYECTLQKQECVNGVLGPVEVIRHAVREEPFAVTMVWEQGAGAAKATLYARGENGGRLKVKSKYFIIANTDPNGVLARGSSRYSIEDAGITNGTLRTLHNWSAARDRGELLVEYLGRQAVTEIGGRECFIIKRTIPGGEVDTFRRADTEPRSPQRFPKEAFESVTIYLDCENWMQVGSVLTKADGSLLGAYWFRDVKLNPVFNAQQFTAAILQ